MIQRVQTLFLLVATILSALVVFVPISEMMLPNGDVAKLYSTGLKNLNSSEVLYQTFPILILGLATSLLSLITIFIYQRRTIQMRLCVYNILLLLFMAILFAYYYFDIRNKLEVQMHSFSYTLVIPLVNIILIFQAFRAIRRDDLLIKSYDRLR
ncbi:MAG: DUF4293 domain-containing protein [Bacteroidales bacterium]|nr:DUF4293 domain-containing protein [Bacteroidales bacterium]